MSDNALNLGLRFILEVAALWAFGYWGWAAHTGPARYLWSVGLILFTATVWAVFRVPGDGGAPLVTVPGRVRLMIEAAYFAGAAAALIAAGLRSLGIAFAIVVVVHYAVSYDRIVRLVRGP